MLAFAERKNCFDYPDQAKTIKIGCNRRRGRPRLTAAALDYQYGEYIEEYVLSDTDLENDQKVATTKSVKRKKATPKSDSEDGYDIFE